MGNVRATARRHRLAVQSSLFIALVILSFALYAAADAGSAGTVSALLAATAVLMAAAILFA